MSLRSLNRQIESHAVEMARQRRCALALMQQQKVQALTRVQRIPLPLAMGVAFAGGFILQKFFNTPAPRTLMNWYLTYRAFSNGSG
jgi:hypothetical protein